MLEIMHSSFSRQFIFEIIPFIILFTTREMKFVDISTASEFFSSVIGRTIIGMLAFTFVSFSLNSVNPIYPDKQYENIIDSNNLIKVNSFTPEVNHNKKIIKPNNKKLATIPYEKYITYATF